MKTPYIKCSSFRCLYKAPAPSVGNWEKGRKTNARDGNMHVKTRLNVSRLHRLRNKKQGTPCSVTLGLKDSKDLFKDLLKIVLRQP